MTFDEMLDALHDLGRGRWVGSALGVNNSRQDRLWNEPFALGLERRGPERWFWPHDLAVSFEVQWLEPVDVAWLTAVGATLVQPVNLVGRYAGEPVAGISGLVVWAGWNDPEVDPRRLGPSWVLAMPDSQGRMLRWEQSSLAAAMDLEHDMDFAELDGLLEQVGLVVVDSRSAKPVRREPLDEEPF